MPLLIVALGVVLLIFLITKLKLNTFVSLIITAFAVALVLGIPLDKVPTVITDGLGSQLGSLVIVFGMGSMIGKLLSESGGGHRIANTLIEKFGRKHIQLAVILASFIIGLALFFEVGLVVLLPIIFIIAKELEVPLMELAIPMAATLNVMHGFIPPHPAPTAISEIFKANIGQVIIYGLIVAIPTVIISGPLYNRFLRKVMPGVYRVQDEIPALGEVKEFDLKDTPKFGISVVTAMMPVILIGLATIIEFMIPKGTMAYKIVAFIGNENVAMLISLIFAIFTMGVGQHISMKKISSIMETAIVQIAGMLFIIGGGGAFKQVLVSGGISDYISNIFTNIHMSPLLAAWIITAILRVSLGSSTVAALTGAGLVTPLIAQTGANPALMVLAVGAGSVFGGHVNDAGFWMVKEYFGLSLKETFAAWSPLTCLIGVSGLLSILCLSLFV
ncbi:gluconate:H+ symporter [Lentilactobacillus laojiaonis]|uniref:gluconate:H+ symporter n=1 Tax=Lentilactobacillus laojiaonis TaxID=2883998 RepID=UPI001D09AB19|nr:gluconate:H+ symporter [Lentilactobacillus laojiaonis]UDM32100.1 gluconate:H+ symporter [Lentilactobacillus laojiaonis]